MDECKRCFEIFRFNQFNNATECIIPSARLYFQFKAIPKCTTSSIQVGLEKYSHQQARGSGDCVCINFEYAESFFPALNIFFHLLQILFGPFYVDSPNQFPLQGNLLG